MQIEVKCSQKIYQGRAFDVRRDQLRLSDGRLIYREVVEHVSAVTIIPLDDENRMWFVRQYRHPIGKYLLELPAGVMEEGESPVITAQREIREEIGMSADSLQEIGEFYMAPGYSTEYMFVYLARSLSSSPLQADEDEFISVEKIPLQTVLEFKLVPLMQDAKTLAALFLARPYLLKLT